MLPGAEPFSAAGSGELADVGVLVLHGFTGSPQSMRPWAEHLAAAGLTVELPLLPGHGTTWQDMNKTGWHDWLSTAENSLAGLVDRCSDVFVMGLSMGGTLTLRLAETHAAEIRAVVTVNPSLVTPDPRLKVLPVLKHLVPSFPGIGSDIKKPGAVEAAYAKVPLKALASFLELQRATLAGLGSLTVPVRTYRSADDHVVLPVSGALLLERTPAGLVEELVLTDSYHVATLDNDAPAIFDGSLDFLRAHLSESVQP